MVQWIEKWKGNVTECVKKYVTPKMVSRVLTGIYLLSLIPLLIIAWYNYPSADDYNIGDTCRHAWVATHSLWEVLKQAALMALDDWFNWMGYFTSIFLMAVHPGVFGERFYVVTTWIMVGMLSASTAYLLRNIFVKVFKADKYMSRIVTVMMLFVTVQCMIGRVEAFYWYCGAVNYIFLHSLSLFYYGLLIAAVYDKGKKRMVDLILASILGFLTGGGNQMTGLNVTVVLVVILGFMIYTKNLKKYQALCVPMGFFFLGFLLNVIAPGNWVRADSASGMNPIKAIFVSFYYCLDYVLGEWTGWPVFLLVMAMIPVFWYMAEKTEFQFRYPIVVVFFGYCLVSAMITPPLFAVGNIEAGRLRALIYIMYILVLTLSVGYVIGWVRKWVDAKLGSMATEKEVKIEKKATMQKSGSVFSANIAYWLVSCGIFFVLASGLSVYVDPHYYAFTSAMTDLTNGSAKEYGDALAERAQLYNSDAQGILEVEPLPTEPALLYFSDIKPDAESWENKGLARYYQKEGVVVKAADLQ